MTAAAIQTQAGEIARLIASHADETTRAAYVALVLAQLADLAPASDIHVHEALGNTRMDLIGEVESLLLCRDEREIESTFSASPGLCIADGWRREQFAVPALLRRQAA